MRALDSRLRGARGDVLGAARGRAPSGQVRPRDPLARESLQRAPPRRWRAGSTGSRAARGERSPVGSPPKGRETSRRASPSAAVLFWTPPGAARIASTAIRSAAASRSSSAASSSGRSAPFSPACTAWGERCARLVASPLGPGERRLPPCDLCLPHAHRPHAADPCARRFVARDPPQGRGERLARSRCFQDRCPQERHERRRLPAQRPRLPEGEVRARLRRSLPPRSVASSRSAPSASPRDSRTPAFRSATSDARSPATRSSQSWGSLGRPLGEIEIRERDERTLRASPPGSATARART